MSQITTRSAPCRHTDICCIIPHCLLQDMADDEGNSDELRSRALKTTRHMKNLREQRREHCRRLRTRDRHHAGGGYGNVNDTSKDDYGNEPGSSSGGLNTEFSNADAEQRASYQTSDDLDSTAVDNTANAPQVDQGIVGPTTFQDIIDSDETSKDQKALARKNLDASQTVRTARNESASDEIMELGAPSDATPAALLQIGPGDAKGTVPVNTVPVKTDTTTTTTPPAAIPVPAPAAVSVPAPPPTPAKPALPKPLQINRTIFTSDGHSTIPGRLLLREGSPPDPDDPPSGHAYTHFHTTLTFLHQIFGLDSLDNAGLPVTGNIDYDDDADPPGFINALWNGSRMLFGDGDGVVFSDFTLSLEVVAHELMHGVVQYSANLPYHTQSGALNEHIADAFGSMAKQWSLNQPAVKADWLIGADLFLPQVKRRNPRIRALRDLAAPGTAFRGRPLSFDRQPSHMAGYVVLPDDDEPGNDSGGVHINSGILNRAFYLFCVAVGGNSWETGGRVWFAALMDPELAGFAAKPENYAKCFVFWADLTCKLALGMFGDDVAAKLRRAWVDVGVFKGEES